MAIHVSAKLNKHETGFPASGKIMETWKMKKTFSRPGKIMEFEKSPKNLEKSWNLKKSTWKNHGILSVI